MTSRRKRRRSGCWLLPLPLLLGLIGGMVTGLLVTWWLWPVEYVDVAPDSLSLSHRQEYIVLVSQAYAYDGNLELAQARLATLGDPAAAGAEVATLAEQLIATGGRADRIRALAELAYGLGHQRAALAAYLSGQTGLATWTPEPTETPLVPPTSTPAETPTEAPTETPTAAPTPTEMPAAAATLTGTLSVEATREPALEPLVTLTPTRVPRPTHTPTVTPIPRPHYELAQQHRTCERVGSQLTVIVYDADGQPQPGVELLIRWPGGEDRFITGLKPELGAGYADFDMAKGETYQVTIIGTESDVAQGIVADQCVDEGYAASWDIVFRLNSGTLP
jgi:hypothetical protein